jgi:hypothetical protein
MTDPEAHFLRNVAISLETDSLRKKVQRLDMVFSWRATIDREVDLVQNGMMDPEPDSPGFLRNEMTKPGLDLLRKGTIKLRLDLL